MASNLTFYRFSPLIYRISSDDLFLQMKYTFWFVGLAINVLLVVFTVRVDDDTISERQAGTPVLVLALV